MRHAPELKKKLDNAKHAVNARLHVYADVLNEFKPDVTFFFMNQCLLAHIQYQRTQYQPSKEQNNLTDFACILISIATAAHFLAHLGRYQFRHGIIQPRTKEITTQTETEFFQNFSGDHKKNSVTPGQLAKALAQINKLMTTYDNFSKPTLERTKRLLPEFFILAIGLDVFSKLPSLSENEKIECFKMGFMYMVVAFLSAVAAVSYAINFTSQSKEVGTQTDENRLILFSEKRNDHNNSKTSKFMSLFFTKVLNPIDTTKNTYLLPAELARQQPTLACTTDQSLMNNCSNN